MIDIICICIIAAFGGLILAGVLYWEKYRQDKLEWKYLAKCEKAFNNLISEIAKSNGLTREQFDNLPEEEQNSILGIDIEAAKKQAHK